MTPADKPSQPLSEAMTCKLMVDTHGARFDGTIWDAFDEEVVPQLPVSASIADLGCGPGLFLFDINQRLPSAALWGYDASPVMIDFAQSLTWAESAPRFLCCNLSEGLPDDAPYFDCIALNFLLHQIDQPVPFLASVLAHLNDEGSVWVYDWARKPLREYLDFWQVEPGLLGTNDDHQLAYKLFAMHNRFTKEDWKYVFDSAGFKIVHERDRARGQHALMLLKRKTSRADIT